MIVHKECQGQATYLGDNAFCHICGKYVRSAELMDADDSPSPFSG